MAKEQISTQNLLQVILVRKDLGMNALQTAEQVAKASTSLITRCFEGSKRFMGSYEKKAYEKVIMAWLDEYDQDRIVVEVADEDELNAYLWTAEMMEIPSQPVRDNKGRVSEDKPITALAVGPYNCDDVFEAIGELIPASIMDEYKGK